MIHLGKDIENREQSFDYRGPVYIHASKLPPVGKKGAAPSGAVAELADGLLAIEEIVRRLGVAMPAAPTYAEWLEQAGGIVARAEIVGCVQRSESPWFCGPNGLVLMNIRPTPLVACIGKLGLWEVPFEVEERLCIMMAGQP